MEIGTILQNIKSLADEAESLMAAEGAGESSLEEDNFNMDDFKKALKDFLAADKESGEEEDDVIKKKVGKDEGMNEGEGSDASDSAEARIEDQPDMNEVSDITKSLMAFVKAQKAKQVKAVAKNNNADASEIKRLKEELSVQKELSLNILKGLGIADKIEEIQKSTAQKPVVNQDVNKTLEFIQNLVKAGSVEKAEEKPVWGVGNPHSVQKDFSDEAVLKGLWGGVK